MNTDPQTEQSRSRAKIMADWLFILCGMIFLMVIIGGLTRLTESGLSMVDWRPVTGWLPPLSEEAWQRAFEAYKRHPEFREFNPDMTLSGYKTIFWLEYIHRLWGRVLGLVFFIPFAFFAIKGWITPWLWKRMGVMIVLGLIQGWMGWYMVQSGLVDRPDVSQYRLVMHLGLALLLYGLILVTALRLRPRSFLSAVEAPSGVRAGAGFISAWIFLTMLSGGLVAGTNAGLTYNTFPLMDGEFIPEGYFDLSPWYLNFFENIAAVQFDHRILAELTLLWVASLWWFGIRRLPPSATRRTGHVLAAVTLFQVGLGIAALVYMVPLALAALHQATALVLFTASLWLWAALTGRRA